MKKKLPRGALALVTVLACLAGLVSPASAAALAGGVTAGTVTLITGTGTSTDTIPLGGTGVTGTGCSGAITFHTTPSTSPPSMSTWQVSAVGVVNRFQLGTTGYVIVSTKTSSTVLNFPGTVTAITAGLAWLDPSGLNLRFEIYTATNQSATATDCAHGTTRTCLFPVTLTIQGVYYGDIDDLAASDTASLYAYGTLGGTSPPCSAPFTAYSGGLIDITSLTAHISSVT